MTSTHRPFHLLHLRLAAALSLALPACPGEADETASDASSTTGDATSTTGDATSTTGDASTSTPTSSSDTSEATSASGTGADTSSGATTSSTGGGDPFQESCEAACGVIYACAPRDFESEAQCVADCLKGPDVPVQSESCDAAYIVLNQCFAQATCALLNTEGPCGAEYDAFFDACGGDACDLTPFGDAEACLIVETCIDGETELYCEGPTCRCLVHGDEVGSCENDVCVDGVDEAALVAKALSCCGFAF